MPYIGNKHRYDDKLITVRLYGPEDGFITSTQSIADIIEDAVSRTSLQHRELADWVAQMVAYQVKADENVLWVDCEIMYANGALFGGVSELVG